MTRIDDATLYNIPVPFKLRAYPVRVVLNDWDESNEDTKVGKEIVRPPR
jgi:hypothetical protein